MRLFVGVWPTEAVRDALAALPRPDAPAVRWTRRDQWHVTLRFYGDVPDDDVATLMAQVRAVAAVLPPRTVTLGPATKILGRGVLMVPAAGLDDVARALADEPFRGHLTLARHAPRTLTGTPITASWEAREIALIRSHLGAGPARYETLAVAPFAP